MSTYIHSYTRTRVDKCASMCAVCVCGGGGCVCVGEYNIRTQIHSYVKTVTSFPSCEHFAHMKQRLLRSQ